MQLKILVIVLFALSCSGAKAKPDDRPPRRYPTRAKFDELTTTARHEAIESKLPVESVLEWTLKSALPDNPRRPALYDDPLLQRVAANNSKTRYNVAAQCAAREVGEFYKVYKAVPNVDLTQFITGWCGLTGGGSSAIFAEKGSSPDVENALVRRVRKSISGDAVQGLYRGELDGAVFVVVVSLKDRGTMSMDRFARGGEIVLEGRIETKRPISHVSAVVTQGTYGYRWCKTDESVEVPRYRITCPANDTEVETRLSLSYGLVGLRVGVGVMDRIFWRDEASVSPTYRSPALRQALLAAVRNNVPDDTVVSVPEFERSVFASINAVRQSFGVGAIDYAPKQAALISKAVIPLRNAWWQKKYDDYQLIVAGLESGWEVSDRLLDADWGSFSIATTNPVACMEHMFLRAASREVVLSPSATDIAIGLYSSKDAVFGYVFSYDRVPDDHVNRLSSRMRNRLNELRVESGRAPATNIGKLNSFMRNLAEGLRDGEISIDRAKKAVYTADAGRSFYQGCARVSSIEKANFWIRHIAVEKLQVAIAVAPVKDDEGPFYSYVRCSIYFHD